MYLWINYGSMPARAFAAIAFIVVLAILPVLGNAQSLAFSSSNPAIAAGNLALSSVKQPIYQAVLVASGGGGNLTQVTFTPSGTFTASDISKYQFWYNTTNNLSTASQNGPDVTTIPASGNLVTMTIYSPYLANATYYMWITVDIAAGATNGHTLTVAALTTSNFSISPGTKSGTMYIGGTQTLGTASPSITPSTASLTGYSYCVGSGPSSSQNFTISGANLTGSGNITVTGSTNYEVSTNNSTFSASVTYPFASGIITAQPKTVYARLKTGLAANTYNSQNITFSGGGLSSPPTVSNSGTVSAVPATPTAGNNGPLCEGGTLSLTALTISGATYSWTGPNSFTSSSQNPTVSTSATTAMSGVYSVTATVSGCTGAAGTTNATVSATPNISQIPTSNLILNYKFNGNANDEAAANNGTLQNSPTQAANRFGISSSAYTFNGSSQYVSTANSYANPTNFTISIWFKTATTSGGMLVGFGNVQTGASASHDRKIYMNNAGQVYFGVYTGSTVTINSTLSYNDNNWHLANATLSSTTGMVLYIDGAQVGSNANTIAQNFTGYWKIGYDVLAFWPSVPTSNFFNGTLDDALVYHTALNSTQVATLYNSPDGAGNNGPVCAGATLTLTSTTVGGATYAWTGPNGFTSSSQNPTLTYSAAFAGVYTVQATSGGCTSTAYTSVTTAASGSTISYTGSPYCKNAGTASVTLSGTAGGTYSSTAGLTINSGTGAITLGTSTAGDYTVTYTEPGGCTATASITVTAVPSATISYTGTPFCKSLSSGQAVTQTGTGGGTYSSTAGLTINASTGAITPSTSTAATYTVTYTVAAAGGCTLYTTTTSVTITAAVNISQIPSSNLILNYKFNGNANDEAGANNGTLRNSPTLVSDRFGISSGAYTFNGSSQYVSTANSYVNPGNYTISIWFKTTTTSGGLLMGFGSTQTGPSVNYDRNLYMNNTGQLYFGNNPGSFTTINSASSYNDNNWHLATATLSGTTGMILYVDGVQVAINAGFTAAQNFTGYWKIGFDNLQYWPSAPTSYYFNGTLDDALVYHTALNSTQVATLYNSPDGAGNNGPGCASNSLNLTSTTIAGATYAWTGPNSFTSSAQNPTLTYSALYAGVYTVQVTSGGCTSTAYTNVKTSATSSTISYAGTPYCKTGGTASVTFSGTAGGTYTSTAGLTISSTTGAVTLGTSTAGTYTVTYTVSGGCTSTTSITVNAAPTTSNAGADQTGAATCGLTTVTLAANVPTIGTGAWSIISGAGGSFGNATSATSTFSGTAGTTYTIRWTISNAPCTASTDDVVITFNRNPTTSAAGADQTGAATCGLTTVTFTGNAPTIGTGAWSIISGAGGTVTTPTSATSTFSGTAGTTYTLRWTISNSPCTASTDDVVITFNQAPTTSAAGADQTGASTCGLTTVTLAANAPSIGTGAWSIISGAGGTVTTPTSATSTFTGTAGTTYTLRWTISNSPCTASTDDVVVTFNQAPTTSAAGSDQTSAATCGLTIVTLAANVPTIGTGAWSIVSGAGGTVTTPTSATSTFSGAAGTTYTLRWTISNSPCTASADDVVITFNQAPTTSAAGTDQTSSATCGLTTVTLAGNAPTVGTGVWSIVSGAGGTVTTPTSATSTFSGTAGTTYTLRWTISNSPCTASPDDVVITFNQNPAATISYTGTPYCSNSGTATVTQTGSSGGSYTSTAGLIINSVTGNITLASSTAGVYTVTYNMVNGPCTVTATTSVTITTLPAATISYSGSPFCKSLASGQSVTQTGTTGGTYSSTAGLTINASTGAITPGTSTAGTYTVTYTMAAANGCSLQTATTSVTITVLPAATISYSGSPFCKSLGTGQSVTQTGTTGGVYSSTAGLSIDISTGDIIPGTSVAGTYTVTYTMAAAGGCADQTATTSVAITAVPNATIAYAGSPYFVTAGTATVTFSGTTGGTYSSTAGLTINATTGDVTLSSSTPGTYTVTYTVAGAGGCSIYTTTASITVVATIKTFTGTGNFSDPLRWTGGTLPTAGENLVIDGACTVDNSVTTDNIAYGTLQIGTATARTIVWAASGTNRLNVSNVSAGTVTSTLNMTNGGTLIIRGTWASTNLTFTPGAGTIELQSTITLPAAYATYKNIIVNGSGINVTFGRATTINGNVTITSGTLKTNNFNPVLKGNWTNNSSTTAYTAGTATTTFSGTIAQTIGGAFATTFTNLTIANTVSTVSLNVNASITGNLSVTVKTFDLGVYTANRATAGGTLSLSGNTILKIGGTNTFPTNFTTNTLNVASTVEYYGTNQTVAAKTYGNLTLSSGSGAAVKTFAATAFAIVGNLTSTLGTGTSVTFTAASILTITGNVDIGTSTTFNGGSFAHSVAGNWVNNGTFNGNTGTITFSGPGKGVSGPGGQNFNNLTVSSSLFTFSNGSINLSGNLSTISSGSLIQATGGALLMTGTSKTISGTGISLDNLTISGTVTTTSSFTLTGNLSVSGSITASTGTITMSGASKIISGAGTTGFAALSVSGAVTTAVSFSISSGLDVSGSFSASAGTATFTGTSSLNGIANLFNTTVNGTSLQLTSSSTLGIANVLAITAGTLNTTSSTPNTVNFNGTGAQNINAITYYNLVLSNGNTKTAAGGITTNKDITIESGTTFTASSFTHSIYGNWNNNGTFIAGTSTIQFLGSATAQITGATTFNILTSNTSSSSTELIVNDNISAAIVNMTNGIITTGSDTITITNTRTGNGFIYGNIQRTHTFTTGVAYAFEGPNNTINFSAVSSVSSITVSVTRATTLSDFPYGNSISRLYTIAVPLGTYTATLRLHYEDDELNGNPESDMGLWKYDTTQWIPVGKTANDSVANYVEQSGLTNITDRWTISINPAVVLWNGSVSSDWNTAANWTVYVGSGSAPPSATDVVNIGGLPFTFQPTISTPVNIKNLVFSSNQAVTLTMASGGTLTAGDMQGVWFNNMVHTINTNGQTITINGDMSLSDGITGHDIDLNIGTGTVSVLGSLIHRGGAAINFSGTGALNIHQNYDLESGTFNAGNGTVNYNGDQNQHVAHINYNNLTISKTAGLAAIDSVVNIAGDLLISSGQLDNSSTTTIAGNVTISSGATLQNFSVLHIGGNWYNNGTFIATGASIFFDGSGTQTISASTFNNLHFNKPVGSLAVLTGDVTIKGDLVGTSGTLDIGTYFFNRLVVGGSATMTDSATLIIGADNAPNKFSNYYMAPNSTVIFNGTATQHLLLPGMVYGNIIFRNAGNKILYTPTTVNGDLSIESGSAFDAGSQTLTLNGNWTNNGTFTPSASTIVCTGIAKTISGVTTFSRFSVYGSYTLLSNLTFDSLLNINSTGSISSGPSIQTTINGDIINSGVINATGTTTISGNVEQNISLINAATTVLLRLIINGSVSPVINSTSSPQFGFVTINNTAGITANTGVTVLYSLIVGSGASFNGDIYAHNILGSVTNNGTITSNGTMNFIPATAATVNLGSGFSSTGIVNFGGAGALTLSASPLSFHDVEISNTNPAGITPLSDWTIANNFTVDSGAIFNAGNHIYLVGNNVSNSGTVNSGTSTFSFNGTADQTITSMIFYNLDAMNAGGLVTLLDATVNNNLSVTTGTLSIGNNEISRNIAVNGNITIASGTTLNVDSTSEATHQLTVSGNIINSGTLNLRPDANSLCNVTFNKVGTQTISGTGATTNFNNITVNKGIVDTSHLDVTATNFSAPNGFLTLNNGSFNLNNAAAVVTPFTTDITTGNFLIPATAGLWVNAGTVNSSNMNWTVAGSVKVTGGTLNMGNAIDNVIIPKNTGNFLVTAGNLNLASRISNPGASWSYGMQGGTMTVNSKGSTATGVAAFNMDATGAAFNMSGGTIVIRDAGGTPGPNVAYNNLSTAGTGFTGGTLQIGNILTTASQIFGIVSVRPIYNLTINSTNATAILQTPVLTVSNNVTVTLGTLNIDTLTLKIGGAISNSGTFMAANGTIEMNGTSAQTIPAAAFAANNLKGLTINNNAGVTLSGAINLTDVLTVANGSLAADGYLTLKSSATATARVAQIISAAITPISGNVIVERYVPGRRKYRLITSPVTTHTNAVLIAGQEAFSIWGNWQNGGINTTPNVGNLITGGSSNDGFDVGTPNASLYTYNDITRTFVGYTTANGKNTKYTPLKAGVAYLMFVYGDRLNSVVATSPHNTVLVEKGLLKTGDQTYNTGSAIPLSGVTGRFTLLGNPFASPINWATIPKTNLDNTYWGWDPNLASTGGYITVTTTGNVTLQAPYSGSTGLNQYIQPGQGFFVKTSASSPVLTIREQDKVSNFNANAFRTNGRTAGDMSLLAINLQYVSSGNKILADGVLAAFDDAYSNRAGAEDGTKMANSGESIAILNDNTALSIDARQMPQNNDTLFLNVSRLTKPQYTLQIFAQEMESSSLTAFLEDRYLNTYQALSLTDTNNIVFNVSAGIPASSDINRFRIVFHSSVIALPVTYTSIKATQKNKDIQIDWEVAEENGILKYEIERSADAINFYKIGEVTARGNNSNESYHWLDVNPVTGNNYYHVRAIQADGRSFISKTVAVKMNDANTVFTIFPNPVKNHQINIRSDKMEKGKYNLQLHNTEGQQILYRVIDHPGGAFNQIIYLSKMSPAGMYYLKIEKEKEFFVQTIFIE